MAWSFCSRITELSAGLLWKLHLWWVPNYYISLIRLQMRRHRSWDLSRVCPYSNPKLPTWKIESIYIIPSFQTNGVSWISSSVIPGFARKITSFIVVVFTNSKSSSDSNLSQGRESDYQKISFLNLSTYIVTHCLDFQTKIYHHHESEQIDQLSQL